MAMTPEQEAYAIQIMNEKRAEMHAQNAQLEVHLKDLNAQNEAAAFEARMAEETKAATPAKPVNAYLAGVKPGSPEAKAVETAYLQRNRERALAQPKIESAELRMLRTGVKPGSLEARKIEAEHRQKFW